MTLCTGYRNLILEAILHAEDAAENLPIVLCMIALFDNTKICAANVGFIGLSYLRSSINSSFSCSALSLRKGFTLLLIVISLIDSLFSSLKIASESRDLNYGIVMDPVKPVYNQLCRPFMDL